MGATTISPIFRRKKNVNHCSSKDTGPNFTKLPHHLGYVQGIQRPYGFFFGFRSFWLSSSRDFEHFQKMAYFNIPKSCDKNSKACKCPGFSENSEPGPN